MSELQTRQEEDQHKRNWSVWVWGGVFMIVPLAVFVDWYPVIKFHNQNARLEHIAARGRKWDAVKPDLTAAGFTMNEPPQNYDHRKYIDLRYRTPVSKRMAVMILLLWRRESFPRWYETVDNDMICVIVLDSAEIVESTKVFPTVFF